MRIDLLEITLICPFQAIFQHIFNNVMGDVAEQIMAQQCFGIEFENKGVYRYMSARFWKVTELCRIYICRSSLSSTDLAGEMGSLSRVLSVASTHCEIQACSGCPADLIRVIDCSEFFTCGVQSCFRFENLSLQFLMHKSSYSVFGHIDLFSVLQALLVSLDGSLNEEWALRSPELSKVNNFPHVFYDLVYDAKREWVGIGTSLFIDSCIFSCSRNCSLQTGTSDAPHIMTRTHS